MDSLLQTLMPRGWTISFFSESRGALYHRERSWAIPFKREPVTRAVQDMFGRWHTVVVCWPSWRAAVVEAVCRAREENLLNDGQGLLVTYKNEAVVSKLPDPPRLPRRPAVELPS